MTHAGFRALVRQYRHALHGWNPVRASLVNEREDPLGADAERHAAWMLDEMEKYLTRTDIILDGEKLNRWLGFVQGILWTQGFRSIDALREDVTEAKKR